MKKFFSQNFLYRLVALILAVLLFAYVKTDHLTSTRVAGTNSDQNKTALMSNKTATISMPVDLDINTSKYVTSGYRENVKISLTGSSALITTLTNTRNFKVYLDLQDYTPGKYTVKYKVDGLGKDVKYKINPSTAKITIAKRKTKNFEIRYRYDTNMVKSGYVIGNVKSSNTTVQATGSADDINRISQVVADINVPNNATKDVTARTVLQALDTNGNIVNVVLTPQSINVTIPISKSESDSKSSSSNSGQSSSSSDSNSNDGADSTNSDDTASTSDSSQNDSSDDTDSSSSISSETQAN